MPRHLTWEQIHAAKVRFEEAAEARRSRQESRPATASRAYTAARARLLGGGGASGGAFCFVDLLPESEEFTPSKAATLRREGLRLAANQ